jgi:hypothetical protein
MKAYSHFLCAFLFSFLLFFIECFDNAYCVDLNQAKSDTLQLAEKVYLHIDRVNYTSGDDIWFRAYVIDPSRNKLSVNTNNLHVELISPDSKIIQSKIIRIIHGLGNGDFHLTDTIPSGIYRIRAYTSHMRNYDEHFFFLKEISVINPYDDGSGLERPEQKIENKIDISFFPEGGSLVDNVTSSVAFKAVNALGKGCDVTVELYSSAGELITIFNSTHLGMGFFNIKPMPGYTYYTIVKGKDGTQIKASLPASFPSGLAIRASVTPDKKLILTVNTNEATLPSVLDHDFTVNLSSRNLVSQKVKIRIDSLVNNYLMPLDSLPDGIIRVTLSEFERLPLAERLFFLQRNEDTRLNITTDKAEYKPREKVTALVSLSGDSIFSGTGDFSFSAAEAQFTDNSSPYPASIASWFLLESDVRGTVEQPSYYFDPSNIKRLKDLDLLLMTQGWRDFKWKYDTLSSFKHEVGFNLSGNVKRIINGKPVDGANINLGLFSQGAYQFLTARTDKSGAYSFKEVDIYGKTEAFISSTGKAERMEGKILVDSLKFEAPETEALKRDSIEFKIIVKEIPVYRQEAIYRNETRKKYKLSDTINIGEVTITATKVETPQEIKIRESRKFYSAPDKELIVTKAQENYGGDVFNYMSGRIPGIRILRSTNPCSIYFPDDVVVLIREQGGSQTVSCTHEGKEMQIKVQVGALILLDGYEVNPDNLGYILSLPMYLIDRVDVLTASPLYGMRGANGVINIITKQQIRRDPVELTANTVYTVLNGFDVPRVFYSPKYDKQFQETFTPDFRSTIFWKPDIRFEKGDEVRIDFYNADEAGTIKIVVEGVSEEGIPVSGKAEYTVK